MTWTAGDVSGSQTLTGADHIKAAHINELRDVRPIAYGGTSAATAVAARMSLGISAGSRYVVGANGDYVTDGTADDVQIQAAIDAAYAAGGGQVYLLPGNYYTASQITLKSKVNVQGSGMGVTTIRCSANTSSWAFRTTSTGTTTKGTYESIYLLDLTIRNITASHSSLISNTKNAGYLRVEAAHADWSTAVRETLVLQHCENAVFYDTFIHDSNGNGVQVNACDYFHVRGNRVVNFYDNVAMAGTHHLDDGIDIDEDFLNTHTVPSRYGFVEFNSIEGSTNGNNIRIASSQYVFCSNNISKDHDCNAAASILVNSYSGSNHPDTHHIYVDDNQVIGGTDSGIKVLYTSPSLIYDIYVRRNSCSGTGSTAASGQLGAGILLVADGVTVTDNILDGCGKNSGDGGALMLYSSVNNQVLRRNRIINSPGAGVRFWNGGGTSTYTGIVMESTEVSNNTSDYAGLSVATFTSSNRNEGLNPIKQYDQGNVTGATSFSRSNGDLITATATGNVTTTMAAGQKGDRLTLRITQDGTGSRTISKPANVKMVGGAFSPTATAAATDSWTFVCDGTNWHEVSRSLNVS